MDPDATWDNMLVAYATKQWSDAVDHAEALRDWLERGGFSPQPPIGTTNGNMEAALDTGFSRAICLAACHHIFEQSLLRLGDEG